MRFVLLFGSVAGLVVFGVGEGDLVGSGLVMGEG